MLSGNHASPKDGAEPRANIVTFIDENGQKAKPEDGQLVIAENSVAIIENIGPMIKYGNYWCWGADEIVALLAQADAHPNVIGTVLVQDTPGGGVNAIAPYIDFIKTKRKPLVTLAEMAASAGYYVASACDAIIAENNISSMFGSIGTMMSYTDYQKWDEKNGIKEIEIYADQSTHKNKAWRDLQEGNDKTIKEELLNPLAQNFMDAVEKNRGSKLNKNVEGILNGRMFFAETALKHGLIDSIGNLNAAIAKVRFLAEANNFMNSN